MKHFPAVLLAFLCSLAPSLARAQTVTVSHPYLGITYITQTAVSPRPETMHIVEVDLTAPGISFQMTPAGGTLDTTCQTTLNYLSSTQAQVAVNGSFFVPYPSSTGNVLDVGLTASNGNVYAPFSPQPVASGQADQSYAILPYAPALNIQANNAASIVTLDPSYADDKHVLQPVSLYNALSGSAQIVTNGVVTIPTYSGVANGGLNAENGYSNSNSWYSLANARTAIGLTQDGKTLVLFTVDDAGGSQGMTPGEVANVLISDYGVYNALNLDGGGSTTLAMQDPTTGIDSIMNVSSDNPLGRADGDNLAIFASPVPEPVTISLLGAGAMMLLARRGRTSNPSRKRKSTMCNIQRTLSVTILAAVVLAGLGAAQASVMVPYSQNFSGGASDFTTGSYTTGSSSAAWTVAGGGYTDTITRISGASFYAYSSVNVSNPPVAANSSFEISTLLSNMSIGDTSANATIGLRFLADTTNSNNNAYVVDLNIGANPGRVRLVRWASGTATVYPSSSQSSQPLVANFSTSDPYELEVFGSYSASDVLNISVEVIDENHPTDLTDYGLALTSISGSYGSTPPTGNYFGYFDSTSSGTNTTISATMGNFAVTPEPATMGLLICGSIAMLARRKRRQ